MIVYYFMDNKSILEKYDPAKCQKYGINIDNNNYNKRKENNLVKENSELFWNNYYSTDNYMFGKEDIKVYDNKLPDSIISKLSGFVHNFQWLYGYKNNEKTTLLDCKHNNNAEVYNETDDAEDDTFKINETILKTNEIQCFYGNVIKNIFFESLFFESILPNIDIENKENIKIDRAHIVGRLHNFSEFFHKDERSTIKYGPSVYVYLNDDWKTYHDGTLSFILDINNVDIHHIQSKIGRIVVFPPNMYHKTSEISGYALFENKMSKILEYHLIYE